MGFLWMTGMMLLSAHMQPLELDEPLHNPLKGWAFIDHAIPDEINAGRTVQLVEDQTVYEWFQNVAVLSTWAQIEKEPGVLDWSLMDQSIDYWASQDKCIHLRFSTEDFGTIPGCPRWLFEMGVPCMTRDHLHFPDYRHPVYLEHLRAFLGELAGKYADDPRIETVNLQGYGEFGEWHSGYNYATVAERVSALRGIVDAWRAAFQGEKFLNLSTSYEWRTIHNVGNPVLPMGTSIYEEFPPSYYDYVHRSVFDYALALPDIAVSRHGVGGAVRQQWEGRLIANFFHLYRKPLYMECFGGLPHYTGPSIVGFPTTREGDDHVINAVDALINHHPNYATPVGWGDKQATDFYNQYRALVVEGHKRMGYRFVLVDASYPDRVAPGSILTLRHSWENRAMGRCYRQFPLAVYLMRDGAAAWSGVDGQFDQRNFVSGETYDLVSTFSLPDDLGEGVYELRLAMVDGAGEAALNLAIAGGDDHKRYLLGQIVVGRGATEGPKPGDGAVKVREEGDAWVCDRTLEPERDYLVSFRYAIVRDPEKDLNEQDPGFFRLYAVDDAGLGLSEVRWFDKAGQPPAMKTYLVSTENGPAYHLVWEAVGGGAMAVDGVRIEALPRERVRRVAVRDDMVLAPGARIFENTRVLAEKEQGAVELPDGWYDFAVTNAEKALLEADTVYTVWFNCAARPQVWQGDYHYLALRDGQSPAEPPRVLHRWTQRHTDMPVLHAHTFRTTNASDCRLVWGMKNGGRSAISRICLVKR
jgi:hypothetical protein